jgi:putative DNA methylase
MPKSFKGRVVLPKETARDGWHSRGYFPHFNGEGVTQHVSFHLFDSLPQSVLARWREELRMRPLKQAELEWRKRIQDFLDSGYGCCFLRDDRLAEAVESALLHFDGQRYFLHAWCVMPNHVHTLFTPAPEFEMSEILHSWKSFAAHECNKLLQRSGRFWAREPFDRYIRNERHFQTRSRTSKIIQSRQVYVRNLKIGGGVAPEEGWPAWVRAPPGVPFPGEMR